MKRKIVPISEQPASLMKVKTEALRFALTEGEESGVSDRKLSDILQAVKDRHNLTAFK